ncbi:MAG: glutathione synthase [Rhodospirillum sp.]|nr:glutathione synthase [Rhodospirillum sp.]MCF8487951.1 glutathione synthase [Rhodospirillum sp.]MCF8499298.1 glutathione synthase [Rhodospirillum sp.]
MTRSSKVVAIQMDPIQSIDINGDSSFALGLEAQRRGHDLFHYLPTALAFRDGRLTAQAHPMTLRREPGNHVTLGSPEIIDLGSVDVVLMRQDPPFDMGYITATHLLEHVHPETLVVNDPREVRNAPEKLFVTRWPELMPPTLITSDKAAISAFREEYQDIIVKPLFGNGGAGVFHLKPGDENLNSLLEMFRDSLGREPLMIQRYMPAVREGDKRIILVDGKPAGAVNRVPAAGESRSNMHVGGRPEKSPLTKRDLEICEAIGPTLKEKGLIFVGIDVIGDVLTEINVTSPTGIQEIDRFDNVSIESDIWDAIEGRL